MEAAGGSLPTSAEEEGEEGSNAVEVSPLVSYAGEGLQPLVEGRSFKEAYDLDLQVGHGFFFFAWVTKLFNDVKSWRMSHILDLCGSAASSELWGAREGN